MSADVERALDALDEGLRAWRVSTGGALAADLRGRVRAALDAPTAITVHEDGTTTVREPHGPACVCSVCYVKATA